MARRRHLSKAPIREAVLDVRVETEEPADPSRLRGALESLDDLLAESRSMEEGTVLPGTFARARRLLDTIPSGFPVPEIALDPDGEVAFDWIRSDRTMLSVSIGNEGDPSYAAGLADATAYGFVRWGDTFPSALKDLLRRLYFPDGAKANVAAGGTRTVQVNGQLA